MNKKYLLASVFITRENMVSGDNNHQLVDRMRRANVRVVDNWRDEDGDLWLTINLCNEIGAMDFAQWLWEQGNVPAGAWLEPQAFYWLHNGQIFQSDRP